MEISELDKRIYRNFTDLVYRSIDSYNQEPDFNTDTTVFVKRLEKALSNNIFEDVIQNNEDIIISVVSDCFFFNSVEIPCAIVKDFLAWFKGATPQSQKLILNNFICKLSKIKVNESEEDFPF